jgi:RimJ/RimL family protein N-acetyltransferase
LQALCQRYPANTSLAELGYWNDRLWWQPFRFGGIRLERRGPQHFDFVWSIVQNRAFARRLKQVPVELTAGELMDTLNQDALSLIPEGRTIQWVVFRDDVPIGLSMFVNINFKNRSAEQIMGILPGFDVSFLVGDAYCASLLFAFNCLGLNKVQGLIYASNESIALQQERLGFRREGLLRQAIWDAEFEQYRDLVQIALLREEFVTNRVLQRHIRRQAHDAVLDIERSVSRAQLSPALG